MQAAYLGGRLSAIRASGIISAPPQIARDFPPARVVSKSEHQFRVVAIGWAQNAGSISSGITSTPYLTSTDNAFEILRPTPLELRRRRHQQ